jgi:hypothetical protein
MRICVLTISPFMEKGGAEILIYELSHAISRKGHVVTIVCGISKNKAMNTNRNIKVYSILNSGKIGLSEIYK